MYNNIFYAHKGDLSWLHIYNRLMIVQLYGKDACFELRIREAKPEDNSPYWGWKDFKEKEYAMIYRSKDFVEMCSPDGFKNDEKQNRGKLVNLVIEEIKQLNEEEIKQNNEKE